MVDVQTLLEGFFFSFFSPPPPPPPLVPGIGLFHW